MRAIASSPQPLMEPGPHVDEASDSPMHFGGDKAAYERARLCLSQQCPARGCRAALIAGDEKKAKECAKGWPYAGYKMTIFSASEEKWVENDILHAKMYFNMPYALTVAGRRGKHWICRFRAQRNCRPRTDHQPESEVRSSNRHKASRSAGLIAKPGPCGWKRLTGCGRPRPSFSPETTRRSAVTAEVAGSSPVVPAHKRVVRISLKPSRTQKGTFSCPFFLSLCPVPLLAFSIFLTLKGDLPPILYSLHSQTPVTTQLPALHV